MPKKISNGKKVGHRGEQPSERHLDQGTLTEGEGSVPLTSSLR
jgi:hypothetical protein